MRIGIVDISRVLSASGAGHAARETLELERAVFGRTPEDPTALEGVERGLVADVLERVRPLVARIGQDAKCDLILERRAAGVLYAVVGVDLTDDVIRRLDRPE